MSKKIVNLKDLEEIAFTKVSKPVYDFWNSGANDLITLKENSDAFQRYRILARTMVDVSNIDLHPKSTIFNHSYSAPIGIAPSAHHTLANYEGERGTAKACQAKNLPMALSSFSNFSVDEVHDVAPTSAVFFQLYVFRNRSTSEKLIRRAERAGFKAVLLTSDTPYVGERFADKYNEFTLPPGIRLGNFEGLDGVNVKVPNPVERKTTEPVYDDDENPNTIDPSLNWKETITWLKSITKMQIWAKGILAPEDAEAAIEAGCHGIWVSNHGGRQLDSTIPTIEALPAIVEVVDGRIPVHFDSGVRSGIDVFKALALGADFVWVGRPALWGLAYDGQAGVETMLSILVQGLKLTMALAGTTSIDRIKKQSLLRYGPRLERL